MAFSIHNDIIVHRERGAGARLCVVFQETMGLQIPKQRVSALACRVPASTYVPSMKD